MRRDAFIDSIKYTPIYDENRNEIHPFNSILDTYTNYTSDFNIEYFNNIIAAIYLEYKRLYPKFDIFIQFRVKSRKSFQKNLDKTLASDSKKISSMDDLQNDISKDILGMKIILNGLPDKLPFERTKETEKIFRLYETKQDNLVFLNKLQNWLDGNSDELQNQENFYNYYIEILNRLINSTYKECYNEEATPYVSMLKDAQTTFEELSKNDDFSFSVSDKEAQTLQYLINSLESRLNDKLENEILDITLPQVLSSQLIKDELLVNSTLDDSPHKNNGWTRKTGGFVALYYNLITTSGLKIELQAQSEKRHKIDLLDHNELPGKNVSLDNLFFELVNEKDKNTLQYYTSMLKQISAEVLYSNNSKDEHTRNIALEYMNHIRIKDTIDFDNIYEGTVTHHYLDSDEYLQDFSNYVSPGLGVTHAAHNKIRPTVMLEKKQTIESFSDVLRKRHGISVLGQMLIDKAEKLYGNDSTSKPYSERDILRFSEKNIKLLKPSHSNEEQK